MGDGRGQQQRAQQLAKGNSKGDGRVLQARATGKGDSSREVVSEGHSDSEGNGEGNGEGAGKGGGRGQWARATGESDRRG